MANDKKKRKIEELTTRRNMYLKKEEEILMAAKSYRIGSRQAERYDADLEKIRRIIDDLEKQIDALEGQRPRFTGAFIPRDW